MLVVNPYELSGDFGDIFERSQLQQDLAAFKTSFWEPVVAPLSQGIPSQYPNSPIPQYAEVESEAELLSLGMRSMD